VGLRDTRDVGLPASAGLAHLRFELAAWKAGSGS